LKIIDSNDNELICRIGSPLNGILLKKVYIWDEELSSIDWDEYESILKKKFIDTVSIKINKRFEKNTDTQTPID